LSASWAAVILTLSAIVASPSSILGQTDDHETRGGRGPSDPAACYTTLPDATALA
jgi:hypothetical protein